MKLRRIFLLVPFAAALALAGCTSDSPSEPSAAPPATPVTPAPSSSFVVTVTANPPQLTVNSASPSTITVDVRRNDTGTPPPDLTPVVLTTTLGEFGSVGSGIREVTLQLVGGRAQAVLFAGGNAGTATVTAQVDRSQGGANVSIGQAQTFFVSSISPGVGNPQGGEEVSILGGGFDEPVRVTFNSATATVLSVSPGRIRVRVPSAAAAGVSVGAGQAVPVTVTVINNVNEPGQATDSLSNGFTYALGGGNPRQPAIFSVTPQTGSNDGGTRVTIIGDGFQSPVQVLFEGGEPPIGIEAQVVSVAQDRIVVISPAARGFGQELRNQTVDIRVRNLNTGFEVTRDAVFRFGSNILITAVGPGEVPYNVPTPVTIHGQGFDEPVTVSLAGRAAAVLSVSGTEVVVRSPIIEVTGCQNVSGPVSVVNIETGDGDDTSGGDGPSLDFVFDVPDPVITNVTPISGGQAGNTTVTITGFGFEPPVRVLFGDQAASIVAASTTQVTVRSPLFTGTFPQETCTAGGGVQGMRNAPTSVDVQVINLSTGCDDSLQRAFSYQPSDTTCRVEGGGGPLPQCSDLIDNDGDTRIDFGAAPTNDPECTSAADNDEST